MRLSNLNVQFQMRFNFVSIILLCLSLFFIPAFKYFFKWLYRDQGKHNSIIWNLRTKLNLLSSEVTPANQITISGWWMDHFQWKDDIDCSFQKWSICSRSLSASCVPEKMRGIFQYVPMQNNNVKGLDLSLSATSDITEHSNRALMGAIALVKLNNSLTETFRVMFVPPIESRVERKSTYEAPPQTSIISVAIMLICHGYSGNVMFSNMVLLPKLSNLTPKNVTKKDIIETCSRNKNLQKRTSRSFVKEILPLKMRENTQGSANDITLTIHLSMDRLSMLERTLSVWKGPVSFVIFVARKSDEEDEDTEWQRIYIQKKIKSQSFYPRSHSIIVYSHPGEHDYPINYLRNLALRNCATKFCFILDADFQPSPDFQLKFNSLLKSFKNVSKIAFVVPAFQYTELPLVILNYQLALFLINATEKRDNIPQTKEELMQLLHRKDPFIQPFRQLDSPESHRLTDYYKWYRADKPYAVHTYSDKYEPYLIVQRTSFLPKFDERFSGYGMNKITFITELYASRYNFTVMPDLWIIHLPHKDTSYKLDFGQNPYQRLQNRFDRFEFVADIIKRYKLPPCI